MHPSLRQEAAADFIFNHFPKRSRIYLRTTKLEAVCLYDHSKFAMQNLCTRCSFLSNQKHECTDRQIYCCHGNVSGTCEGTCPTYKKEPCMEEAQIALVSVSVERATTQLHGKITRQVSLVSFAAHVMGRISFVL